MQVVGECMRVSISSSKWVVIIRNKGSSDISKKYKIRITWPGISDDIASVYLNKHRWLLQDTFIPCMISTWCIVSCWERYRISTLAFRWHNWCWTESLGSHTFKTIFTIWKWDTNSSTTFSQVECSFEPRIIFHFHKQQHLLETKWIQIRISACLAENVCTQSPREVNALWRNPSQSLRYDLWVEN